LSLLSAIKRYQAKISINEFLDFSQPPAWSRAGFVLPGVVHEI
jgi:hypothetical protein